MLFLSVIVLMQSQAFAQKSAYDSTGLPGGNFSLQGALEMFQISKSPDDFEKLINTKESNINNLDLAEVRFLKQFQSVQVVAFNEKVLR